MLEIGTGWGGFAIQPRRHGCRDHDDDLCEQAYAVERVHEAGLDERVEVLLRDYRDVTGTYDKLVSIEMIEAVGRQYFPAFFAKCAELTRPGGAMFLQAIVIQDEFTRPRSRRSFSNKHIFPGGCLPSQAVITRLSAKNGMRTDWTEEISAHYARTLAAWRDRFNDAWPSLRPHGYDERFARLWNFYLGSSEAGFTRAPDPRPADRPERRGAEDAEPAAAAIPTAAA